MASTDTFYNLPTFKEQSLRYVVKSDRISSNLSISATTWEDVGTYYCGLNDLKNIQFGQGTFLMIKGIYSLQFIIRAFILISKSLYNAWFLSQGANMISHSVVQQPKSQSVQPGDSVALSCSVHTDHCAAEHTDVMWLKNSHRSAPQMIYSSGNRNHTCQRTENGETTCVYNLLMRNLSSDDAGTYYCVVTSCGHVDSLWGEKRPKQSTLCLHRAETIKTFFVGL